MGLYSERIFPWIMDHADTRELRAERFRVLSGARGRVLEIGGGTGANFPHYGTGVDSVTAVEPSAGMNRRAGRNLCDARIPVRLVQGDAQRLPFRDGMFETVVAVLVLCTVPNAEKALAEARRVLVPGGQLLFLEHVRAPVSSVEGWQRRLQPIWKRVAGGCELTRDTERRLVQTGFAIEEIDRFWLDQAPRLVGRMIRGRAVVG